MNLLIARATTWWTILRITLEERLVYRGDFALGTVMRFLPIITMVFLWWSVFESVGNGQVQGTQVAGYSFRNMVAYYLLTMLGRAFSSMPTLASGIALQIRQGEVKKFLIQPVDMLGFLLVTRIAHKLAYYSVAIVPFAMAFFLGRGYFEGFPPPDVLAVGIATLVMGFLLGFYLEVCIGLIGFWFLEVSSLLFVYMLLSFFLSGHMFPLDMLPQPWNQLVDLLPLKYLAYFPAAVFLQKVSGPELIQGVLIEVAWILFFILLSRIMFHYGVKRYSGYGG